MPSDAAFPEGPGPLVPELEAALLLTPAAGAPPLPAPAAVPAGPGPPGAAAPLAPAPAPARGRARTPAPRPPPGGPPPPRGPRGPAVTVAVPGTCRAADTRAAGSRGTTAISP